MNSPDHGKLTRDFERHPRGVLSDGRNKLFDGVLFEKDARMGEEDVEDAMTDFHGGREDDGDVFQAHLVDFFVFDHVDHVDDGPRQEQFVEWWQLVHERHETFDATLLIRQRAGFVEFVVERRRQNGLRQFA